MNNKIFHKKNSKIIFDLGIHPYADTFLSKEQLKNSEPIYPLRCYLNSKTGLIFNDVITNNFERYNLYDYSYTSSNSKFSRDYWISYGKFIKKYFKNKNVKKILEVGSNDGFLLKQLKKKFKVNGVDASKLMAKIASNSGIKTYPYIFGKINIKNIKSKVNNVDLIIANNVFNHANNPVDFLKSSENLLENKKYLIIEVPYWKNLVQKKQFDQIYHEHVTYITIYSFQKLLSNTKFNIIDIIETNYHGGSVRIICQKNGLKNSKIINQFIKNEFKLKLFNFATYKKLEKEINLAKYKFLKKILLYKSKGYNIVGIGAAAKANTFINFLKLDYKIIDFICDISPFKRGKYTPLSRIPIKGDGDIKKFKKKFYAIILSWNLSRVLKPKLLKINKKIHFIDFKI
jgi:SAM-dependent methyltransferase